MTRRSILLVLRPLRIELLGRALLVGLRLLALLELGWGRRSATDANRSLMTFFLVPSYSTSAAGRGNPFC